MRKFFTIVGMVGMVLGISVILAQEKKEQGPADQTLSSIIKLNKKIENITFTGVSGEKKTLEELKGANATIVAFLNFQCPISNKQTPELIELGEKYKGKKVNIIGICCDVETPKELASHINDFKITFPVFYDPDHIVSTAFLADFTPQVFLIDSSMTLRYFGRINDQYEDRATKNLVIKNHDLREALTNVLANKEVVPQYTQPVGCPLERVKKQVVEDGKVTYYRDVLPIMQKNCQQCHRPGDVGPFSLMTFKDALNWADLIQENVVSGVMPPWKPTAQSVPLRHDSRMSKQEIETINKWVEGGCARGDQKNAPPPVKFKSSQGWDDENPPDMILEPSEDFNLGPLGEDHYRTIVLPLNNKEEVYVRKTQFIPGNPKIVHHALYFYDGTGMLMDAQKRLGSPTAPANGIGDWGPGYNSGMGLGFIPNPAKVTRNQDNPGSGLGGWVPAVDPITAPPETSYILPPQCDIFMQIHYHRNGRQEKDRSKLGLWFTKKPPTKFIKSYLVDTTFTVIPAGVKKFKSTGSRVLEEDIKLFTFSPHAHMTAKESRLYYSLPGSKEKVLLFEIKDWDFNWQQRYYPVDFVSLPKGTTIHDEWIFDNSSSNPQNPFHPAKTIFLGENTTDEMGFYIIAGVVEERNRSVPTQMLDYFERLLKAEALKKLFGAK
jgi:peroxiredoxin